MTNIVKEEAVLLIGVYDKLHIPNEIGMYSSILLTMFIMVSLSANLCIYFFDLKLNKKIERLILLAPFLFLVIAIYKYYQFDFFVKMLSVCIGLNISNRLMLKYTNIFFEEKLKEATSS
ncbi:MAG: hypothetical protein N4A40_15810 [Tissierellales bacterium]|jgi:hypothetical protein|nr:hypothetical protein [Tissierellales bacterium]